MIVEVLLTVLVISIVMMQLVEAIVKPLFLKLGIDVWWLFYVAFVFGTLVGWASSLNAFTWFVSPYAWVGQLLTALACGAGPSTIYNIIDKGQPARLPN